MPFLLNALAVGSNGIRHIASAHMDNLMALDTQSNSLEDARDYIKALAPWVSNDQIVYNSSDEPIGVSRAHVPFPLFIEKLDDFCPNRLKTSPA